MIQESRPSTLVGCQRTDRPPWMAGLGGVLRRGAHVGRRGGQEGSCGCRASAAFAPGWLLSPPCPLALSRRGSHRKGRATTVRGTHNDRHQGQSRESTSHFTLHTHLSTLQFFCHSSFSASPPLVQRHLILSPRLAFSSSPPFTSNHSDPQLASVALAPLNPGPAMASYGNIEPPVRQPNLTTDLPCLFSNAIIALGLGPGLHHTFPTCYASNKQRSSPETDCPLSQCLITVLPMILCLPCPFSCSSPPHLHLRTFFLICPLEVSFRPYAASICAMCKRIMMARIHHRRRRMFAKNQLVY